jgi:serine/threonine protein kinase/Tol biopolymer transport system component
MSLPSGSRIGAYEIVAKLGAGGMGEVYRARDSRLHRDVAIKVLPDAFTRDRDRVARFEREARVLATLSHSNIATIYGVEDVPGASSPGLFAIVLELVEGDTLADRLARGRIPVDAALKIARQIAEALDAAHRQKIVHRDLKPGNVKVTAAGSVKVLDFGLATVLLAERDAADDATAETATAPMQTLSGMVLGTPAYMSPEQARGQAVDERTDIWAFGCVLYEMLTGRRPFAGKTSVDLVAALVHKEPDWNVLPAETPPIVRRLLRRCLQKDPTERVQHAGDLRLDLTDALAPAEPATAAGAKRSLPSWIAMGALGVLAAITVVLAVLNLRPRPSAEEIRFEMGGGVALTPGASVAVAPDGRQILVAPTFESSGPSSELWLRSVDSIAGRTLAGTEGAFLPFWSPSGSSIGYFANRKLWRLDLQSGVKKAIADAPVGRGAAWSSDGKIVFAPAVRGPLMQVDANSGTAAQLTKLADGQNDHRAPQFLPGEQYFLYYARGESDVRGVFVARRDGTTVKRVIDADAPAVYAPPGHLLFVRQTTLFAQPFDLDRLEVTGVATPLAESIALNRGVSLATLSASPAGTIAYGVSAEQYWQFAWFDRSGKRLASAGPNSAGGNPSLSPDGKSVALNRVMGGVWDIWILELDRGGLKRVTSDPELDFAPVWTPDGRHVVFQSSRGAVGSHLVLRSTDGTEPERVLLQTGGGNNPTDVSRDGNLLVYDAASSATASDVWALSLTGDSSPRPLVQTRAVEREGQLSPNGKWLAYSSNETTRFEVYVQPYPGPGPKVMVSNAGGNQLRWSRSGDEMFYVDPNGMLNAVKLVVKSATAIEAGKPAPLFQTPFAFAAQGPRAGYVVSADGQRFLMNAAPDGGSSLSVAVILNWQGKR